MDIFDIIGGIHTLQVCRFKTAEELLQSVKNFKADNPLYNTIMSNMHEKSSSLTSAATEYITIFGHCCYSITVMFDSVVVLNDKDDVDNIISKLKFISTILTAMNITDESVWKDLFIKETITIDEKAGTVIGPNGKVWRLLDKLPKDCEQELSAILEKKNCPHFQEHGSCDGCSDEFKSKYHTSEGKLIKEVMNKYFPDAAVEAGVINKVYEILNKGANNELQKPNGDEEDPSSKKPD